MAASDPEPPHDSAFLADEVFADFLMRKEGGEGISFAELCRAHPALQERLRTLNEDWERIAHVLDRLGLGGSLATRIRERFGPEADPGVLLPEEGVVGAGAGFSSEVISRLSERSGIYGRYRFRGELSRGGMGVILRVWDEDLRRTLAMKVILGDEGGEGEGGSAPAEVRRMARFLEEAQVTGQLDHPGIVPVHELGLDPEGRVYFTMKLVKGDTLKDVFDGVRDGKEGWTREGALGMLLKVCEAMSYAHDKRVIHRDLKPANIMVGRYGEVFVMDWGLARLLDRKDDKDLRIRAEPMTSSLHSERRDRAAADPDSPLVTMDGDVVGTPAYMSPEQAGGRLAEMGPQSDVYAVGAMLYHLLAGHMPYVPPDARLNNYAVWSRVQEGAPRPLHEEAPDASSELVAICEMAMAREPGDRYRDMSELGRDLRAYMENRVVQAYRTGAWAETRKWVRRNPGLARSLVAVIVLLVVGLSVSLYLKARAEENAAEAQYQEGIAKQEKANVMRLSAFHNIADLVEDAEALWPAHPEHLDRFQEWLDKAEDLRAGLHPGAAEEDIGHLAQIEVVRGRALPATPEEEAADERTYRFANDDDAWWYTQLVKLIADIRAFHDEETGLVTGISPERGWGIQRRVEFARTLRERSVTGPEASRLWDVARAAIAANPKYDRLKLNPQLGLLPLREDPHSNLWEFWHLQSGERPLPGPDGKWLLTEETGLVFVLLPGGEFLMGSQSDDPEQPFYIEEPAEGEQPLHRVVLSRFFLSKYEMTQGQWTRLTGSNPSRHAGYLEILDHTYDMTHPVEFVNWQESVRTLGWMGLSLPTEAQWEYGARGGTATAFWTGDTADTLYGAANVADQSGIRIGVAESEAVAFDDEHELHAPVGNFLPNPFGLHDVHGNVWEWCLDAYDPLYYESSPEKDPVCTKPDDGNRVDRGGGYFYGASYGRSARRNEYDPEARFNLCGLRPARAIDK